MKKIIVLSMVGMGIVLLLATPTVPQVIGQENGNVILSLALDPHTATNNAEDNQPFAVLINVHVPQNQPVAALDATLTYNNTKLDAVKVLPGNKTDFANGYFGVTAKVDSDSSCKDQKTDQAVRLKCAINQDEGIVSLTAINVDANQFLTAEPSAWPVPTTHPVTGDFTLATVIFQPRSVGPSGDSGKITLDIGDNHSNAYSWVDLAADQDSRQVLSDQPPNPLLPIPISNNTNCDTDFNRDGKIWGEDLAVMFADFRKNCTIEYCRSDINNDGKIWGDDLARLFSEYSKGQNYCRS